MPTLRLDHATRLGQPLLVLVRFHEIQQVGVAGELDKIPHGRWSGSRTRLASCPTNLIVPLGRGGGSPITDDFELKGGQLTPVRRIVRACGSGYGRTANVDARFPIRSPPANGAVHNEGPVEGPSENATSWRVSDS